jgi:hypothetical protein
LIDTTEATAARSVTPAMRREPLICDGVLARHLLVMPSGPLELVGLGIVGLVLGAIVLLALL